MTSCDWKDSCLKEQFTPKYKSTPHPLPPCWWKVKWCFVVHKTFLELHNKTALQRSARKTKTLQLHCTNFRQGAGQRVCLSCYSEIMKIMSFYIYLGSLGFMCLLESESSSFIVVFLPQHQGGPVQCVHPARCRRAANAQHHDRRGLQQAARWRRFTSVFVKYNIQANISWKYTEDQVPDGWLHRRWTQFGKELRLKTTKNTLHVIGRIICLLLLTSTDSPVLIELMLSQLR